MVMLEGKQLGVGEHLDCPQLTVLVRALRGEVGAEAVEGSAVPRARDQHLLVQDPQQPPAVSPQAAGQHLQLSKGGDVPRATGNGTGASSSQHLPRSTPLLPEAGKRGQSS